MMTGTLDVEMVGVGHGDCFVLKWVPAEGDPSVVVIDGGPRKGGARLQEALTALSADKIDLMVLSHTDADHVDGLLEYARLPSRLPIGRFWGPCLPAFERHRWLFPSRIRRGLDVASELHDEFGKDTSISWPVENASWQSEDGGFRIRVLSPAGRLIERLLIGEDALSLFLEQPMPIGWLLEPGREGGDDELYGDLRAAVASGEIDPARVPKVLPPSSSRTDPSDLAEEAARDFEIDPEFFGNSVLNDTSIVLLVEADVGGVSKRLLFTGDLQTFTYIMANYPTGLGLEVVKAPHHGSRSHVGEKLEAYDEVWQWLRPRAVLVSAGGKHGLPRNDFRAAALRSGASLFCACQRTKEVLVGPQTESSCHAEFSCGKAERSVRLEMTKDRIEANAQACGSSGSLGAPPVIHMVQHLVDPSAILDRLTTAERDRHVKWVCGVLENIHAARRDAGGEVDLDPVPQSHLEKLATVRGAFRAATAMEVILDAAVRAGKVWTTPPSRLPQSKRFAWTMPNEAQWLELSAWLLRHAIILLPVDERKVGRVARELLIAADTSYLEKRVAELFAFPEAMFRDVIWPHLVETLIEKKWLISYAEIERDLTSILCIPIDIETTFDQLIGTLNKEDSESYLEKLSDEPYYAIKPSLPHSMLDIIVPLWSPLRARPRSQDHVLRSTVDTEHRRIFLQPCLVTEKEREALIYGYKRGRSPDAAPRLLAAYLVGGHTKCS